MSAPASQVLHTLDTSGPDCIIDTADRSLDEESSSILSSTDRPYHSGGSMKLPSAFSDRLLQALPLATFLEQRNPIDQIWKGHRLGYVGIGVLPCENDEGLRCYVLFLYIGGTISFLHRWGDHSSCLTRMARTESVATVYRAGLENGRSYQDVIDTIRQDLAHMPTSCQKWHFLAGGLGDGLMIHHNLEINDSLTLDTWHITFKVAFSLVDEQPLWLLPLLESASMRRFDALSYSIGTTGFGGKRCQDALIRFDELSTEGRLRGLA